MNKYNDILKIAIEMKASPLSLFRVDKRKIKKGDFILPNNEYFSHLDGDRDKVEKSLIRTNPNPDIKRENILFLFDDAGFKSQTQHF